MANNAYAESGSALASGFGGLMDEGDHYALIPMDMIEVKKQIREDFEDEENSLADLAASIKARGVLQPILLRPTENGYELIAGERRFRASKLAGLEQIPSFIRDMNDEDAEDAQLAENIHRKNLTQIEEAKKIQADLNKLGSVQAVLDKHQKSKSWLSKIMGLIDLPEQAKRLITENISADPEVIGQVKTIEKINPAKAKALVDDLKVNRKQGKAREKTAAVKEEVKPGKKSAPSKNKDEVVDTFTKDIFDGKNSSAKSEHEAVDVFAGLNNVVTSTQTNLGSEQNRVTSPAVEMNTIYVKIFEDRLNPKAVFDALSAEEKEAIEGILLPFYDAGKQASDVGRAVILGFRNGQFSCDGDGAFALVSFLHGSDSEAKFNLLNILGSAKE
jgi:ParB family chromosome partitioning protein